MDFVHIVKVNYQQLKIQIAMLYSKLTNCPECEEIPALLADIDCKIKVFLVMLYLLSYSTKKY